MKNSRQTSLNKGTRGANARSPEDSTDCSESDKLTASMLTKALDSLRVDICTKIEPAVGGVQADIAAVREELTSSVSRLQKTVEDQEVRLTELETSASNSSDAMSAVEATVSKLQGHFKELQLKCEDLENRSWRNNIKPVSIPEDQEGVSV